MTGHINVVAYLRVWGVVCLPIIGWIVGQRLVNGYVRRRRTTRARLSPGALADPHPELGRQPKWCSCPVPKDREDLPFTPVCALCGSYISAQHWRDTARARAARDARADG